MAKIKKQLTAGRPKTAVDKANLPEKPLQPKTPHVPKVSTGELPKEVIGSHMGVMLPSVGKPKTLAPRAVKMPPPIPKG